MKWGAFEAERSPTRAFPPFSRAQRAEILHRLRHDGLGERDDNTAHNDTIDCNIEEYFWAFWVVKLPRQR